MKKVILAFSLLLLTGCSVDYNITITDKQMVKEKFYVYVNNDKILETYDSVNDYLEYYSNMYQNIPNGENYNIKTKQAKKDSYFLVKRDYKNLEQYFDSNTFKSMFNSASITKEGNYTIVMTSKNAYLESLKTGESISNETKYDDFKINIKFYNEVVESNADMVDKKSNVYTWNVVEDDEQDFIYFKISPKVKYNIIIMDYIQSNLVAIISILITIIAIISTTIYFFIRSKKNNEV